MKVRLTPNPDGFTYTLTLLKCVNVTPKHYGEITSIIKEHDDTKKIKQSETTSEYVLFGNNEDLVSKLNELIKSRSKDNTEAILKTHVVKEIESYFKANNLEGQIIVNDEKPISILSFSKK